MDPKQILRHCDHTLLRPTATWPEIRQVCDDALAFGCASACIPPAYIRQAAGHVGNELKLCTVIGFPNGSSTTAVKVFETEAKNAPVSFPTTPPFFHGRPAAKPLHSLLGLLQ